MQVLDDFGVEGSAIYKFPNEAVIELFFILFSELDGALIKLDALGVSSNLGRALKINNHISQSANFPRKTIQDDVGRYWVLSYQPSEKEAA